MSLHCQKEPFRLNACRRANRRHVLDTNWITGFGQQIITFADQSDNLIWYCLSAILVSCWTFRSGVNDLSWAGAIGQAVALTHPASTVVNGITACTLQEAGFGKKGQAVVKWNMVAKYKSKHKHGIMILAENWINGTQEELKEFEHTSEYSADRAPFALSIWLVSSPCITVSNGWVCAVVQSEEEKGRIPLVITWLS